MNFQYADVAQQAFSSEHGSTLHLAIPALETLHKAWSSRAERPKYARCGKVARDWEKSWEKVPSQ